LLNDFQTLAQKLCRSGSGLKPDRLADKRDRFGFGFSHLIGCKGSAFPSVPHLVGDLMHQG
jgi:hypothetical protein